MKIFVICKVNNNTEYNYQEYSEPLLAFKSEEDANKWVKEQESLPLWDSYSVEEIDLK